MEYTYTISYDPTVRYQKPPRTDRGKISNAVRTSTGWTINEFLTYTVQPYGYTWSPGIFDGSRKLENWIGQNTFGLDFDDKNPITVSEVLARFQQYGITPNLVYSTFSDTDFTRFRVVVLMDEFIQDAEIAKGILNGLHYLFPEADQSCNDLSRMFFGGRRSELISPAPVPLQKLVDLTSILMISADGGRTRNVGEKQVSLYKHNRSTRNSPNNHHHTISHGQAPNLNYLISLSKNEFDFERCRQKVKILDDFLQGRWLDHNEIFGLATNLHWAKGGLKMMKETMDTFNANGVTEYTENNYSVLKYAKKVKYLPKRLEHFSPHQEDHQYSTLHSATHHQIGAVDGLPTVTRIPLQEAESLLEELFHQALSSPDKKLYLFKVATGLGKTRLLETVEGVTIALPTHQLIREVQGRMKVAHTTTPETPVFSSEITNTMIQKRFSTGLYKQAYKLIRNIAGGNLGDVSTPEDVRKAGVFLNQQRNASKSKLTVLTTHQKAIHAGFDHDTIIFDEDPLGVFCPIQAISQAEILRWEQRTSDPQIASATLDFLRTMEPGNVAETPLFGADPFLLQEDILEVGIDANLVEFYASKFLYKDPHDPDTIYYATRHQLPQDKKLIIMSATVPVELYQHLFGAEEMEVVDISHIEHVGQVIQNTHASFSLSSMATANIASLQQLFKDNIVITHKRYAKQFGAKSAGIYFHNCSGSDQLKGKDVVVLGTPHSNNAHYRLYAAIGGLQVDSSDTMEFRVITWKGMRFRFMTFENEQLSSIQLSLIESELVQAVGRARVTRTYATVFVYSNLPLVIADQYVNVSIALGNRTGGIDPNCETTAS